ncbi:MAG: hypothetical protein IT461_01725 [Planctomycetes bacterium]|jgi:hypothetical protein|nr:hypothetical protein [Planctomycetota bacterium]
MDHHSPRAVPTKPTRIAVVVFAALLLMGALGAAGWAYYVIEKPITTSEVRQALESKPGNVSDLRGALQAESFSSYATKALDKPYEVGRVASAKWIAELSVSERSGIVWYGAELPQDVENVWLITSVAEVSDAYLSAKTPLSHYILCKSDGTILGWLPPRK